MGSSAGSVTPAILAAVLFAAVLHATWNAIAHGVNDRLVAFAMIGLADVLGGALVVSFVGLPPAAAWPFIIGSALAHIAYNSLLLLSYGLGEFSQVYPLARGTAPVIVACVSLTLLGHDLRPQDLLGILTISAGLIGLVVAGGGLRRAHAPAVAAAFATGLMIALYTVIDGLGVVRGPLLPYIGWLFLLQGPVLPVVAVIRRRHELGIFLRTGAAAGLAGGFISLLAYAIVLWAQTSGALAPIAALRESSIVVGALIGAAFLHEPLGHRRAVAAAVVLCGVVLLSV
ncbi:MAG: EamA family transporter [Nocardioidaceae bacterium]